MTWLFAIGSPFGNDNISWRVADELQKLYPDITKNIHIHYLDRPGAQLANEIHGKHPVIILDALLSQKNSCELLAINLHDLLKQGNSLSSHDFSLADSLQLLYQLGHLPTDLDIFGIEVTEKARICPAHITGCAHELAEQLKKHAGMA